jgi:V8-like Glu-specific endopeptidase
MNQTQIENSVFAIMKISYNAVGESTIVGGICGTAFLINNSTFITAYHVLNRSAKPNPGYLFCNYWLLSRNNHSVIPIEIANLEEHSDSEFTLIHLRDPIHSVVTLNPVQDEVKIDDDIFSIGYSANTMPVKNILWTNDSLHIQDYSLDNTKADNQGKVKYINKMTVNAIDVRLNNIEVIQPTFGARIGMSGGPLLKKTTNTLIGLMSFGLPADKEFKEVVYAISVNELSKVLHK